MKNLYSMIFFGVVFGSVITVGAIISVMLWPLKYVLYGISSSNSFVLFFEMWSWSDFFTPWLRALKDGYLAKLFISSFLMGFVLGVYLAISEKNGEQI